jgi:geranylgeranyl diphosphate synthase type I
MANFKTIIRDDKRAIDADIAEYVKHLKSSTKEKYSRSDLAINAYCDILTRGGKRLRGALVIEGYKMSGGTNQKMILQAARAIEMIHAYLLVIDDIQDRSSHRRGGLTAHLQINEAVRDEHLAEALATNAALLGNHVAMTILANLDAPAELRSNILSIVNRTLLVTVHGQIADMVHQDTTEKDVRDIQEWKTATYSILNPLHVGMVLAGVDCQVTDGVTPYAHAAGQAFQITDDIIGTFGSTKETGKDIKDDIREGKRTLLTVYALNHANSTDQKFLRSALGNTKISAQDFENCQRIIRDSGALEYAQTQAQNYVSQALIALDQNKQHWSPEGTAFLKGLAEYLLVRTS